MKDKDKDLYEWPEKSFEDRVKREMNLPVWERPSLMRADKPWDLYLKAAL